MHNILVTSLQQHMALYNPPFKLAIDHVIFYGQYIIMCNFCRIETDANQELQAEIQTNIRDMAAKDRDMAAKDRDMAAKDMDMAAKGTGTWQQRTGTWQQRTGRWQQRTGTWQQRMGKFSNCMLKIQNSIRTSETQLEVRIMSPIIITVIVTQLSIFLSIHSSQPHPLP